MAYTHTFIHKDGQKTRTLTALQAIREKCMECCCWYSPEVKNCPCTDCVLHPFRMGRASKK